MPTSPSTLLRRAGAALFACAAGLAQASAPELVQVGAYRVQMAAQGAGPYTVILESGFGRDLSVWRKVAPALAASSRVVAYSRAGHGRSDPRPGVPDLAARTGQLEELITAAGLKPPFILVGHSYGAFLIRSFAARHPQQVAGMVFVDPSHERFNIELRKLDPAQVERDNGLMEKWTPPAMQAELRSVQAILDSGVLRAAEPLPDVPAVVLTSVQRRAQPQMFLETPAAVEVWRNLHQHFFREFRTGSHVVTPDSGHNIHLEQPELVIAAVQQVIAAAEARARRERGQAEGKATAAAP